MNADFRFDDRHFAQMAAKLAAFADKAMSTVLLEQAGLGAWDAQRFTPPYGPAPMTEGGGAQKRLGEKKIKSDISRAFFPIQDLKIIKDAMPPRRGHKVTFGQEVQTLLRRGNYLTVEAMLRQIGIHTLGVVRDATPELLAQLRNRRGNVRRKVSAYQVHRKASIGRLVKRQMAKLGVAKAGWNEALIALGREDKIPAWVKKHTAAGLFSVHGANTGTPQVIIGNGVPYVQGRYAEILGRAMDNRTRNITLQVDKVAKALARKALEERLQ